MRVLFFYGTGGGSPLLIMYFKRDYVQDKKRKEKLQHREPIAYNRMVFCLRSRDNHGKLLEDVFTSLNSWCLVFKDIFISGSPNTPSHDDNDFHKEGPVNLFF